jgi:hypothetical protein
MSARAEVDAWFRDSEDPHKNTMLRVREIITPVRFS